MIVHIHPKHIHKNKSPTGFPFLSAPCRSNSPPVFTNAPCNVPSGINRVPGSAFVQYATTSHFASPSRKWEPRDRNHRCRLGLLFGRGRIGMMWCRRCSFQIGGIMCWEVGESVVPSKGWTDSEEEREEYNPYPNLIHLSTRTAPHLYGEPDSHPYNSHSSNSNIYSDSSIVNVYHHTPYTIVGLPAVREISQVCIWT